MVQISKVRTAFFAALCMMSGALTSCDLLIVVEEDTEYPTKFPVIDRAELELLNEEYHTLNNNRICSTLNTYGFTGYSAILFGEKGNPCDRQNREVVRIEMTNTDTLAQAAKKVLLQNSSFTGVTDTAALELQTMVPLPGCTKNCGKPDENSVPIEWKLTFGEQRVDSGVVKGTEITVVLDANGANRIWGNWYPDFTIPDFVNYGYADVQQGMIGWQIDMRPYTGYEGIYSIKAEDLSERPSKVFLPVENNNSIEIRACWCVPVNYQGPEFEGWMAYIDIEYGSMVKLAAIQKK